LTVPPNTPSHHHAIHWCCGYTKKDVQKQRQEDRIQKQDVPRPLEDEDQQMAILQESLKKSKKLRNDRDVSSSLERIRSKTRAALP
jgi:hypothetical protein